MVVQVLDRNPGHAGKMSLHIGSANVKQYFPRRVEAVELELDHLSIACLLPDSFWEDRPEIRDIRLSIWLEAKRSSGKLPTAHASLVMVPQGDHAFRLQILSCQEASQIAEAALIPAAVSASQGIAGASQGIAGAPQVIAFDRRNRSISRHPERRRIGKLKGNDSPASAASH